MNFKLRHFISLFAVLLTVSVFSHAAEQQDLRQRAIELAQEINKKNLIIEDKVEQQGSYNQNKRWLRNEITDGIFDSSAVNVADATQTYREIVNKSGSEIDRTAANFFESILYDPRDDQKLNNSPSIENKNIEYLKDDHWFIRHRSNYIAAGFKRKNPGLALEHAQTAFKAIPEEESFFVLEAKMLSAHQISMLHNILGNFSASIPLTIEEIELKQSIGDPIDGTDIINNLIHAFSLSRDHETSEKLVEILLEIESRVGSDYPGLTQYRAAEIHNQLGNFDKALTYSEEALALAERDSLRFAADLNGIVALAGLGRVKDAEKRLNIFEGTAPQGRLLKSSTRQSIFHMRALAALANNDLSSAERMFAKRLDTTVQNILTVKNTESESMLASLQNSKDRREERESAMRREGELKQEALDKQQNINRLLLVLAGILALSSIAAFSFARYRSKIAHQMEIAAKKAQAGDKAKSEFLAVMSHELRTPLNGIMGMADYLSRAAPTEDMREKNEIILQSGQDLLELVENILDMTLLENDQVVPYLQYFDLRDIVVQIDRQWRKRIQTKKIVFTTFVHDNVPIKFESDQRRVKQCLNVLLSNAAKFTTAGRIHLHVTNESLDGHDNIKIIVADTGIGMAETILDNLFKPFVQADSSTTRDYGGAGLGVSIAKGLSHILGGDLTVNSREGRGSEFVLTFKGRTFQPVPETATEKTAPILEDQPTKTVERQSSETLVMLLDQDSAHRGELYKILSNAEFRILPDNMSSVQAAQQGLASLAILHMDVEQDALGSVRSLRENAPDLPIIAITSNPAASENVQSMAAGVSLFLTKPVNEKDLTDSIGYLVRANSKLGAEKNSEGSLKLDRLAI